MSAEAHKRALRLHGLLAVGRSIDEHLDETEPMRASVDTEGSVGAPIGAASRERALSRLDIEKGVRAEIVADQRTQFAAALVAMRWER